MIAGVLGCIGSGSGVASLMGLCHPLVVRPQLDERWLFYAMQGLVLFGLVRSLIQYKKRRQIIPLLITILSSSAIIYGLNNRLDTYYIYAGIVGLLLVSVWSSVSDRRTRNS
jgi:hypothetical protein